MVRIGMIILLVLIGLISGCSSELDVTLHDAEHSDVFLDSSNKTVDRFDFVMRNNERFDVSCDAVLSVSNDSVDIVKRGIVGVIPAFGAKEVGMEFEMPLGESSLSIEAECVRSQ